MNNFRSSYRRKHPDRSPKCIVRTTRPKAHLGRWHPRSCGMAHGSCAGCSRCRYPCTGYSHFMPRPNHLFLNDSCAQAEQGSAPSIPVVGDHLPSAARIDGVNAQALLSKGLVGATREIVIGRISHSPAVPVDVGLSQPPHDAFSLIANEGLFLVRPSS